MQATQTQSEGLTRAFTIFYGAERLVQETAAQLQQYSKQVKVAGFRPGKVPSAMLRQRYLKNATAEVLENLVEDGVRQVLREHKLNPALQPKVTLDKYEPEQTLEFQVHIELMPEIPEVDFSSITLTKPEIAVTEAEIEDSLQRIAEAAEKFEDTTEPATEGDEVTLDFIGSVAGKEFNGGKAEDFEIVIGSGRLIPGFEDQLVGVKTGETKTITVTFPENYTQKSLAGKEAQFALTIKAVKKRVDITIDDAFAKEKGHDDLNAFKEKIREWIGSAFAGNARDRMKRDLLNVLDKAYVFDVPPTLMNQESAAIFKQMKEEAGEEVEEGHVHDEHCNHAHTELPADEELKPKCDTLATRRVKLGLLLASLGTKNQITVSDEEVRREIFQRAFRYEGAQVGQILRFFADNPKAVESIKAPLFEDKVVDFILEKISTTSRPMTKAEFDAEMEALEKEDLAFVGIKTEEAA